VVEKELTNKDEPDFDRYIQGPESTSIKAKSMKWATLDDEIKVEQPESYDFENDKDVYNPNYEKTLMMEGVKTHKSTLEDLPKKDKMLYYIVKWIFNAIKKDEKIHKEELLDQLAKNEDIMNILGFDEIGDAEVDLYDQEEKGDYLNWDQFLRWIAARQGPDADPWRKGILEDAEDMDNDLNVTMARNLE